MSLAIEVAAAAAAAIPTNRKCYSVIEPSFNVEKHPRQIS